MAHTWTKAQENAIRTKDRTLLVSAAAGSGKTAVLTERIVESLADEHDPSSISRMLIVTFTRAAAAEMHHRIEKKLAERLETDLGNKHLASQLMLLGGASISTIDSFYLDIVKQHFEQAGLPSSFRMADESELLALREDLMNETVDAMYRECADFAELADLFSAIRTERDLAQALLKIATDLLRYPDGIDFLLRSAEEIEKSRQNVLDTTFGAVFAKEAHRLATQGKTLADALRDAVDKEDNADALRAKYLPVADVYRGLCEKTLAALDARDYDAIQRTLTTPVDVECRGTPRQSEAFAALRKSFFLFCDTWDTVCPALAAFCEDEIRESASRSARLLRVLHETLTRFDAAYRAAKAQREIAEFSDVSRAAYRLLVDKDGSPTPIAREIAESYDAIFIDEYQDVDAMQDATFRAVSKPTNRFMVGDIKQSIYRFRGAQPAVFAGYKRTFPSLAEAGDGNEATIFMSNCFRCDESIIRFTNTVSGALFSSVAESIGYTSEDDLVFSKDKEKAGNAKCRVTLVTPTPRKRGEAASKENGTPETRFVASEIARLVAHETLANGKRIAYSDIAILVHSRSICADLVASLTAYGIPVNDTSRQRFFENPDVLCVYSLLAALDNPQNDVYLAATLRSPFFNFTLEDLVRMRNGCDKSLSLYETVMAYNGMGSNPLDTRVADFKARFALWRERAVSLPVDRLLRYLYRETAVLSLASHTDSDREEAAARRATLQRLYEYARTFESGGFKGLYQFVRYVESIMENGVEMPPLEGKKDAVSILTVHGSKGLEFPVCFLVNTGAPLNRREIKQHLLHDAQLGCAMRLPNAGAFSRSNTFHREMIARSVAEQARQEEMRVLYVALTRARERLYVTAKNSKDTVARALNAAQCPVPDLYTETAGSYIAWILAALYRDPDHEDYARIDVITEDEIAVPSQKLAHKDDTPDNGSEICHILRERFAYEYPHAREARLPAKLSVSRLSPGVLDVYDTDATSPDTLREADVDRLLHTFERAPQFGADSALTDAAARGTATHEFLQFCRFDACERHGVAAELDRLIDERFLPPETKELVRMDELERFFESDFYATLRNASRVHRETRFHVFLPAEQFASEDFAAQIKGEKLAVQGVIDLFFYDAQGNIILCDYKTDRLTYEELRDPRRAAETLGARHGQQLAYYARAIAEICGKAPDKILIYSLPLGAAVEIQVDRE